MSVASGLTDRPQSEVHHSGSPSFQQLSDLTDVEGQVRAIYHKTSSVLHSRGDALTKTSLMLISKREPVHRNESARHLQTCKLHIQYPTHSNKKQAVLAAKQRPHYPRNTQLHPKNHHQHRKISVHFFTSQWVVCCEDS